MERISRAHKFISIVSVIFILDQLTKRLAEKSKISVNLIEGVLSLDFKTNTGGGFGILEGRVLILAVITIIVLAAILYYFRRTPSEMVPFTALVFGGALGNLIDRLILGHVVDFIDISFWPTFNIADIAITTGILGLIYFIWKK
ncbi:MAG: signal peptidase II [Candidatus Woesearchaeota archaeon]